MDDRARYDPGSVPDPLGDIPATDIEENDAVEELVTTETEAFTDEYENVTWSDLRRYRFKRMFLMIIVLGTFIGISVGVGVHVNSQNQDENSPSSNTDSNSNTYNGDSSNVGTPGSEDFELKTPPSDLEILCSETNINKSQEGFSKCLHACQPAQCCEIVDTNPFSCLQEFKHDCRTYHKYCQHLQTKKVQDAAAGQETVDQVCSTTSLSTPKGVKQCTNLCSEFMCCFPDKESNEYAPCSVSQAFCADYGACSALLYVDDDGFDSHQEAKATIEEVCFPGVDPPSYEQMHQCDNMCGPAQCCFVDPYDGVGDMMDAGGTTSFETCMVDCAHYEACSIIYGDYHPDYNPDDSMGGGGVPQVDNEPDDTDYTPPISTPPPKSPTPVSTPPAKPPAPPNEITQMLMGACSDNQLKSLDGVRGCMEKCQYHLCCFTLDDKASCANDVSYECEDYEPCRALVEHEVPINSIKPMDEVCTYEEVVINGDAQACLNTCASHLCCTIDPLLRSSCYIGHKIDDMGDVEDIGCQEYEECKMLAPIRPTDVTLDSDLLVNLVEQHCTEANIQRVNEDGVLAGLEYCHNLCQQRACCWVPPFMPGNCLNTDPDYCEELANCEILLSPEYVNYDFTPVDRAADDDDPTYNNLMDDISVQLGKVCNTAAISTEAGFHECYDQCYYHLCCFISEYSDEDSLNCADERLEECHEFSACSILMASDVMESPKEVVEEKCDSKAIVTTSGFHECHRYCAEHLCCFQDTDADSSCFGLLGMAECNEYRHCSFLTTTSSHPDPYNHNDPFLVSLIEDSCTVDKVATDVGREECREYCVKRACCFYSGSDRCYNDNPDWCDEVQACEVLFDIPSEPIDDDDFTPTNNPLNEICNLGAISTLEGFRTCYDACYDNMCCFINEYSDEASLKCLEDRPDECAQHAACAVLLASDIASATREAVDQRCVEGNVGTPDGFHECHRVCADHLCCFQDEENPSYCVGLLGQERCDHYRSCAFLMSTSAHPDPFAFEREDLELVNNVASACTLDKVASTDGHEACRLQCLKRACCFFTGEDNCKDANPDWCNEVSSCDNLFHEQAATIADPTVPLVVHKSGGPAKCESAKVGQQEVDIEDCVNECESRRCCFSNPSIGGCYEEDKDWCDEYSICEVVFGAIGGEEEEDFNDFDPNDLANDGGYEGPGGPIECDDSAGTLTKQQLEDCEDICQTRACCFQPVEDGGCYKEATIWCEEASLCTLVMGPMEIFP
eukprot:CAMPEP_0195284970 /NCGR_PEP_ID=MMETSP0707-20130614/2972_1 /TAXON_ID=33640 /ORGANISM="Asterionellopsis glacialis, Strain CCMP134" /LENGTH=1243 /DNA_ID=CAMNT_0040344389 /DNA_START=149 /DNA_END=3880 /DNA_ORIENTATION=-